MFRSRIKEVVSSGFLSTSNFTLIPMLVINEGYVWNIFQHPNVFDQCNVSKLSKQSWMMVFEMMILQSLDGSTGRDHDIVRGVVRC